MYNGIAVASCRKSMINKTEYIANILILPAIYRNDISLHFICWTHIFHYRRMMEYVQEITDL